MRWLPHDAPLSRQSTSTEEHLRRAGQPQNAIMPETHDAAPDRQDGPGRHSSEKEAMERSQTGHLDSIAEQEAPQCNGDLHVLENGHSEAAQEGEQYETLTFHVGGMPVLQCFPTSSLPLYFCGLACSGAG